MTCKDCMHYDICSYWMTGENEIRAMNYGNSEEWVCYKDKSRFVELPCKVGDKLYDISEFLLYQCYAPEMYKLIANDICISKDNRGFLFTIDGNDYRYEDFGVSVFLAREEAESKLKKLNNEPVV